MLGTLGKMTRGMTRVPFLVLAAGFAVFLIYSRPGFMSTDSADQLMQARGIHDLNDWHPPLMAVEWRALDWILSGPLLMLLLQGALFLAGTYRLLRHSLSDLGASIASVSILLFPPVLSVMAVIWKDSQMAAFAIAGMSALLSESRQVRLIGIVMLTIALGFRANAAAAIFPIVACLVHYSGRHRTIARVFPVITFVSMIIAISLATWAMRPANAYAWHRSLAPFDLVGMIKYAPASDEEILRRIGRTEPLETANLRQLARSAYYPRLHSYTTHPSRPIFRIPETESQRQAVSAAWLGMLKAYPLAYLKHRWAVFREVIGFSKEDVLGAVYIDFMEEEWHADALGHQPKRGRLQSFLNSLVYGLRNEIIFRPYLYLLLGLIGVFCARRSSQPVIALLLSGLLYECSLVVAAPSSDYRYSHWMVVCVTVSLVLIFVERWKSGQIDAARARTSAAVSV